MNVARTRLMAAALAAALAFLPAADACARGGFRGGGFRSAPSIRSFGGAKSLGTSRAFSGWGSATKPTLKPKASSSAPASTPRLGGISGDRASVSKQRGLYDSAKRNGTLFSSREEAAQSFRGRYAKDYGSSFASEPATRPSYIPAATTVAGRSVPVGYNPAMGGYGYIHPMLGTWILFDALGDAAMLNYAMSNRGYYWGGAPAYVSHGPGFMTIALGILVLLVIAGAASSAARRRAERDYR